MSDCTVLVTGCGAPGFPGTLWSLRRNPDGREIRVVGVDMREDQAGRHQADAFATVPAAEEDSFVPELVEICRSEDVDVVLPQVTRELPVLADATDEFEAVGTQVAVPPAPVVERANDKGRLIDVCERLDVPAPETLRVETADGLVDACDALGYPDRRVVVKPPVANGSRGMRILDADRDRERAFYEEKPTGVYATRDGLLDVLGDSFPPLLVTEYLPGDEFTVDAFRSDDGRTTVAVPRRREEIRAGISFRGTVVDHDAIVDYTERLADELGLTHAFGFQFKLDADGRPAILECNPRVQGTMVMSTMAGANVTYAAVKEALGEPVDDFDVDRNVSFHRYWAGLATDGDEVVGDVGGVR